MLEELAALLIGRILRKVRVVDDVRHCLELLLAVRGTRAVDARDEAVHLMAKVAELIRETGVEVDPLERHAALDKIARRIIRDVVVHAALEGHDIVLHQLEVDEGCVRVLGLLDGVDRHLDVGDRLGPEDVPQPHRVVVRGVHGVGDGRVVVHPEEAGAEERDGVVCLGVKAELLELSPPVAVGGVECLVIGGENEALRRVATLHVAAEPQQVVDLL